MATIPPIESLKDRKGYAPFMKSLQAVLDLQRATPAEVRWVEAKPQAFDTTAPPSVLIDVARDHPLLAVTLHPIVDGSSATSFYVYNSPLILKEVQRWGQIGQELGKYSVTGVSGVPEKEELFPKPKSLTELIGLFEMQKTITAATPVVEAVALLPVALNGEFATEFNPSLRFNPSAHAYYKAAVISQDRVSAYIQLSQGRPAFGIKDVGENQALFNWKADRIPKLSAIEKLLLPNQAGRMILIVTPVEAPKPVIDFGKYFTASSDDFLGDTTKGGSPPITFGGQTRELSVEGVRIGRGSLSGHGSLYIGELKDSNIGGGNAVVYDLRFFAVRPDQNIIEAGKKLAMLSK